MKKVFTLVVLAAAMMFSQTANAQAKFGIKAGLNVTSMSLKSDVLSEKNRAGFFIGPTVKLNLPLVGLGLDGSVLYDYRSADVEVNGVSGALPNDAKIKQHQIVIPINLRYSIGLGSKASVFAFAGPQVGFNVGSKDKNVIDEMKDWRFKTANFSLNFGVGAMLIDHLQISANYNLALGKTGEFDLLDELGKVIQKDNEGSGRIGAWQISLGYFF